MGSSTHAFTDRVRLVPVVLTSWGVALWTTHNGDAPLLSVTFWVLGVVVVLCLAVLSGLGVRRRGVRHAAAIIVLALACGAAVATHVTIGAHDRSTLAEAALDGGRAIDVRATVSGKIEHRVDGSVTFDVVVQEVTAGADARRVHGDAVIRIDPDDVSSPPGTLDVGAVVSARGSAVPGRVGARAVWELRASELEVISPASGLLGGAAALRQGLVAATSGLPDPGAGLVPGLSVGDTSAVDPTLDEAMKQSSLSHLTAVSGANCALVVGLGFLAAAGLGAGRRLRVCVGLVVLVGFVILVTPEPSVIRAATMAAIAMLALLLGRTGVGMSVLSLAVVVLLVLDPWLSGSLGFALSVAATASLLLLAKPLTLGLARWLPRSLALLLAVPLAAQLACGPLLILIEPSVPVFGVLANVIAAPAAPAATVIGLLACLTVAFPLVQSGLAAVAWIPATWIAVTADTVANLPGDLLPWIDGWLGATALALLSAACAIVTAVPSGGSLVRRGARAASAVAIAVVLGAALGSTATRTIAGGWTLPDDWSILQCDIGQGDAVLIRSHGAVALVDTGPDPEALDACLSRAGIARIDLLVLTHFDLDHVGGTEAVLGRVGTVVHGPPVDPPDDRLLDELTRGGAHLIRGAAGHEGALGEARWRVVWPPPDSPAFPSGNDASVVIDIRGGGVPASLFLGDLSESPQRALAASGELAPPYAVVKVAHHGSRDQDPGLYAEADPSIALIGVGADNDYGHPRREILDVLTVLGVVIARTDTQGITAVSARDDDVVVWHERG
ncbi:ComEC/Rec2 family competence protein [Microbacterium sp. SLBN-146]|uniref:ComEC/Rec2 family competence protein n=1 Tax=Microbacterium sp. SLBN-146 TaxID=2768457 RepID=UPI00114DE095|nr:ComEC/Rec2 family competence protein [Microbacterium sp. SLBN-146]TQJ32063.1 competence protein ComEC [Microbacterium sp. SLBN-146]